MLNNAVKFTRSGEVLLDIRLLAKENDKYHLSFTVKDTGVGMTEEQINKLFKPFEQGDSSISRRFGGSSRLVYRQEPGGNDGRRNKGIQHTG